MLHSDAVQLAGGFRYLNLDERLDMNSFSQGIGAGTVSFPGVGQPPPGNLAVTPPATVTGLDSFHTRNQFYGGQIGARSRLVLRPLVRRRPSARSLPAMSTNKSKSAATRP